MKQIPQPYCSLSSLSTLTLLSRGSHNVSMTSAFYCVLTLYLVDFTCVYILRMQDFCSMQNHRNAGVVMSYDIAYITIPIAEHVMS